MQDAVIVSAPGKVLVAGGYLVLDQKYSGVVVSTSSRFYTVVQHLEGLESGKREIYVKSPQFDGAEWFYDVDESGQITARLDSSSASKNKFVQITLEQVLKLAVEVKGAQHVTEVLKSGLIITILADNDFYSQRAALSKLGLPSTISSLSKLPPFLHTGVPINKVHKTGLGSSAALVTSLVAALLVQFSVVPSSALQDSKSVKTEDRELIHNAAQFIHCLAQGKVGSGFDVSSAVFGSQLYTRFNPQVLDGLMSDSSASESLRPILSPSNSAWDHRIKPFQLPPFTRLMLADVDAGSDTPSLVGKVLQWRKANQTEADILWDTVDTDNGGLSDVLSTLSTLFEQYPEAYKEVVSSLAHSKATTWNSVLPKSPVHDPIIQSLCAARKLSQAIRSNMKKMGDLAGVPIEPAEQTELLDACIDQVGVVGGGVPGAGGYDAIWLLVLEDPIPSTGTPNAVDEVEAVWSSWTALSVSPLSATESIAKGIRLEHVHDVPGLSGILPQTQ